MFFKRLNGKSQFRVLLLIIAVIFATENTLAADASRPFEEWVEQLKGLEGHKAAAFRVGPELVKLEPDFGLKVVETAWGELADYKVKTGLLKAFHWGKSLRPKKHRHVIKILHLGMTDSNSQVRDYASYYLQDYSMEDFRDNQAAYLTWYKEFGNRPIEEIVRLNKLRTPSNRPVLERKLKEIVKAFQQGDIMQTQKLANEISMFSDPFAIPTLIGIIDADNSYDTVYRIGRSALSSGSALGKVTQVDYSYYHDGAWWRRWWEKNKSQFSQEVQNIPIPVLPKTEHGQKYIPFPENMDTLEGQLAGLLRLFEDGGSSIEIWSPAQEISKLGDPRAIPTLIGLIEADNTHDTIYGLGYYGLGFRELGKITGVTYDEKHDGAWWRNWWESNKSKYPEDVQKMEIPDYSELVASWRAKVEVSKREMTLADVKDVPAEDLLVGGNAKMRYFLIGGGKHSLVPKEGYNLMVVMPGGHGDERFHPFVRRIYKNALSKEFLVAQPVAFKWHALQNTVWPTKTNPVIDQKFGTEDFVEAVIKDVKKRYKINERNVFTLSWSSSGAAAYAISMQNETAVRGSYIMGSVFRRHWLPPLEKAKGHVYLIDHSPEDKVCPFSHAKDAQVSLEDVGAIVRLSTYKGGHGWHGDTYGRIRSGISWLIEQADRREYPVKQSALDRTTMK